MATGSGKWYCRAATQRTPLAKMYSAWRGKDPSVEPMMKYRGLRESGSPGTKTPALQGPTNRHAPHVVSAPAGRFAPWYHSSTARPGPPASSGASKPSDLARNEFSGTVGQRCFFAGGSARNCRRSYLVISGLSLASTHVVYPESNSPTSCSISNNLEGPLLLARIEATQTFM